MPGANCTESAPIESVYSQSQPSETITLGKIDAEITEGSSASPTKLEVSLQFVPEERLVFVSDETNGETSSALPGFFMPQGDLQIDLLGRGPRFRAIQTAAGRFIPKCSVVTVTRTDRPIKRTVFHLFNFPKFYGSTDYILRRTTATRQGFTRCGLLVAMMGGWRVQIAANEQTNDAISSLEERGGWRITHVGEIVRGDGAAYSSDELENVLLMLHQCLSFATGRWAGLALPVGYDENNVRVFEQWGLPLASDGAWSGTSSCFDDRNGDMLADLIPGFWRLWSQPLWRKPIGEAIYWYLGASDRRVGIGVDTGLILAQAALELLAWNYCVRDRALVSEAAFAPRKLSAADRLRLLVSSLGIPKQLPTDSPALHARRGKPWIDGLEAITEVRNLLVHPHENRSLPDNSYYEAWRLSMWYIDLVILRLCAYNGRYANRLKPNRWAGEVDPVPWATSNAEAGHS